MARVQSVDIGRVLAIFAVIVIHTNPFAKISTGEVMGMNLATMLNQLSRFAVPFLFVLSGFFGQLSTMARIRLKVRRDI